MSGEAGSPQREVVSYGAPQLGDYVRWWPGSDPDRYSDGTITGMRGPGRPSSIYIESHGPRWLSRDGFVGQECIAGAGCVQRIERPVVEATIVSDSANPYTWRMVTVDIKTGKASPGPIVAVIDPLDVEVDGNTLRECLVLDEIMRRDWYGGRALTTAQRSAVSAHWSAQLRAKIADGAAADKARETSVVVDLEDL